VMFRGVKIGSVTGISFRFDPDTLKYQIPVFIETEPERVEKDRTSGQGCLPKTLKMLIDKGLRAQLESQSFVTGQLMIALDFHPDKPAVFVGDGSMLEIPTIPSSMEQLTKSLEKLPLEELVNRITSAASRHGPDMLNSPELTESIANLNQDLKDIQKLLRDVNCQIGPIGSAVQDTVRDAQKLVRKVEARLPQSAQACSKHLEDTRKLVRDVDKDVDPLFVGMLDVIKQAVSSA
jgi:paraquat-inducible protein B